LIGPTTLSPTLAQEQEAQGPATLAAYQHWLAADPARPLAVAALEAFLTQQGVAHVVPTWQLIRTATSWRACGDPFAVPERALWPNMVPALRFVRERIVPAIGPVEPVAVYRDAAMNACAGGARASAHRSFHALDLIPARPLSLADLTAALCPIHAAHGPRARIGLGFYAGRRFHVDARGFRSWGPDQRGRSSPCRS
jgi:uncharacterized protein YggT (Ycf19 family)